MKIEIDVVRNGNELLYKHGELVFDTLRAHEEFLGGGLTVVRGGAVIDQTESIEIVGTHAAGPCFCGLQKVIETMKGSKYTFAGALYPEMFEEGDRLVLSIDVPAGFNFAEFLREYALIFSAMLGAFEEKRTMNIGELREKVDNKTKSLESGFRDVKVLRFRKGESQ